MISSGMQETAFEDSQSLSFLNTSNHYYNTSFSSHANYDRFNTQDNSFSDNSMVIEDQGKSSKSSKVKRAKVLPHFLFLTFY